MTATATAHPTGRTRLDGIDHLEWWVGNARAFTGFLSSGFGFDVVAYAGPETGRYDRVSYLLRQGRIRFVVSGALGPDSPIARHVREHGDGVRDVCFLVDDVDAAHAAALAGGAVVERPPADDRDGHGVVRQSAIRAYGETVHTFLDRSAYGGPFAPTFAPADLARPAGPEVGLGRVDHVVANVALGDLDRWVGYYERVLGLEQLTHFDRDQISTEHSALMSTVVWDHDQVVLPLNEPAEGRRKSQIEEYLDAYRAPACSTWPCAPATSSVPCERCGPAASASWTSPPSTTRRPGRAWPASTCPGTSWPSWASWSTGTTTGTSCRSSPRP